jgi:hypothetical protein
MAKEIAYSTPGDKMVVLRPNALFDVGKTETVLYLSAYDQLISGREY